MISKVLWFFINWFTALFSPFIAFFRGNFFNNGFEIFNSARLVAAGFATIALAGVGVGVGYIFGQFVYSLRGNSKEEAKLRQIAVLGFAVTEAIGLFALMIVFYTPEIIFCKEAIGILKLQEEVILLENSLSNFLKAVPKVWGIHFNKNLEGLLPSEKQDLQVIFEKFSGKVYYSVENFDIFFDDIEKLISDIEYDFSIKGNSQGLEDLKQIKDKVKLFKEQFISFKEDFLPKLSQTKAILYKDIP